LKSELRDKIRAYTRTVYKRMDMQGVVRMDFLVGEDKPYLCEVNTVPGSLAYYLFCERVTDARSFFSALIEDALQNSEKEKKILSTGILKTVSLQRK
jgi:D-alanine-D-alanine ligase